MTRNNYKSLSPKNYSYMKSALYLYVFLYTSIFFAQNSFDKANKLYQKEEYQAAINTYQEIITTDKMHSAELYFNIANSYFKLNKVAPAIYYYEKALVLQPNDTIILNNLKFAKKLTIDEIKDIPKVGFGKLLQRFTSTFEYNNWAKITIAFSFLFLVLFIGYYFSQITLYKRLYFTGMLVALFGLLIALGSGIYEKTNYNLSRPAIIFAEKTELHNQPKKSGAALLQLHEGTKVYVTENLDRWRKVELTDGTEGYLEAEHIKEVK